jgi:hypothetical protein
MNHSDKIAADKTSLGFEFQDLVYIEKLIKLKPGQKLGLELHDDIHVETVADDESIEDLLLIQVKHSVNLGNITDSDIDLWKTLDNWLRIVPGLPSSRAIKFQLYTNKNLNNQAFVSLLKAPFNNIGAILEYIRKKDQEISMVESRKPPTAARNPIAKYVESLSQAGDADLRFIFERFEFHSDDSSILGRISSLLRQYSIPVSRIDETRKYVIGAFKESKFSKIINDKKVVITFDDFRVEMGFDRIVRSARADSVDFERFIDIYYNYQRPDTLSFCGSRFHDQLKDIGISNDEIIDRGIEMMLAEQFMESLRNNGSFSASEECRLENRAVSDWRRLHNQSHRNIEEEDESAHLQAAKNCYDSTMCSSLKAGEIELPSNLSCGKYIKISNIPRIGWRKNWQSRFDK